MLHAARRYRSLVQCLTVLAALTALSGCSRVLRVSGVRFESFENGAVLAPTVASSGYTASDRSTADIYLSDITIRDLGQADSFDDLTGTIVRVRMFVAPRPGKTPIEPTASTATVQAAIFAAGEVGIYGGGAFLLPSGKPGDRSFGGSVRGGSVRLLSATPGFQDKLGAARFTAGVNAPNDEASAALLAHFFEQANRVSHGQVRADAR
ncbi:MAG: hypothetical protein ACF8LK_03510 [Phycisphaerales bacterium JB041]